MAPGQFHRPGQHRWVGGPTRWCLACLPVGRFFAHNLDYFIMTKQLTSIYQDLVPSRQIIVTRKSSQLTGTLQKRMPTPTQVATPHTSRAITDNEIILCTLDRLKTLTITEKARLLYRDNASPSTGTHYLDKFHLTRQLSENRWIS